MRSRRDLLVIPLLGLVAAVYWPTGQNGFVNYDDPDYVTDNSIVQRGLSGEGLAWAFGTLHGRATYWQPLTWLTHMVDCQFFGLNATGHHLSSLLLHTANVLLVWTVLRRMTGDFWRSTVVAVFFAVHPLAVESVAWVSERKNLLSTFFWLLMLLAYVRYAERPKVGRYWPVPVCFALGLMAKPILVTLPFALLLLDTWPLRRLHLGGPFRSEPDRNEPATLPRFPETPVRWLIVEKLPLLILAAAAGLVTLLAHRRLGMVGFDYGLSLKLRVENALVCYGRYIGKLFWPSDLCAIYPHPGQWPVTTVVGSVLFLVLVTGWVVSDARRRPYLFVGWLWFLGLLLPTIGLVQVGVQPMADRFAYVPMIGLLIMVVWGFADLLSEERQRGTICALLAGSAFAACALVTSKQLRSWKDSVALYQRAIAVTENNFLAHNNLGYTLEKQGLFDQAMWQFVAALRIRPDLVEARYQVGLLLGKVQRLDEAAAQYRKVIELDGNWSPPRLELAKILTRLGKTDEAKDQLSAVLRLTPADPEAHSLLAMLLARQHKPEEAIAEYRDALRLKPDRPDVLNNLAWLLATHPNGAFRDGHEAVRLAERACDLTQHQKAMFVGTLAAAYAEAGRFDDAVRTAENARALATATGDQEIAATNLKLAELYRQSRPYRDELR